MSLELQQRAVEHRIGTACLGRFVILCRDTMIPLYTYSGRRGGFVLFLLAGERPKRPIDSLYDYISYGRACAYPSYIVRMLQLKSRSHEKQA